MDRRRRRRLASFDRKFLGTKCYDTFGSQSERSAILQVIGVECFLRTVQRNRSGRFERTSQFQCQRLVRNVRYIVDIVVLSGNVKNTSGFLYLYLDLLQIGMNQQHIAFGADIAIGNKLYGHYIIIQIFYFDQFHRIEDDLELTRSLIPRQCNPIRFDSISCFGQCLVISIVF